MSDLTTARNPEPMWPTLLALMAAGALFAVLPDEMALGPRWVVLALIAITLIPAEIAHALGQHKWCRVLGYVVISIVTVWLATSVSRLVLALGHREISAPRLLASAAILWATNIITFAVWYWRLDAGGPHKRNMRATHSDGAFLFPQMTVEGYSSWAPHLVDYLFLAFNTSTALSPTDVPVLSRWAKILMMIQSAISLTIVALLAARAVNVL